MRDATAATGRPRRIADPGAAPAGPRRTTPMPESPRARGVVGPPWALLWIVAAAALVVAACTSTAPTPGVATVTPSAVTPASPARGSGPPGASAAAGAGWQPARVEQPGEVAQAVPSAPAFCSPCHSTVETAMNAVAAGPRGLVAVGNGFPPSRAAAWYSSDGRAWTLATSVPAPEGSVMLAAAATAAGFVAVGSEAAGPGAWRSDDGRVWSAATVAAGDGVAARMLAVVPWKSGYLAAGEATLASGRREAAVWRSADGSSWTRGPAGPALADASIDGLATDGARVVAVGSITATGGTRDGAAWVSTDGIAWRRTDDASFRGADPRSVVAGGSGFVAAGSASGGMRAAAWTSPDGVRWTPTSDGTYQAGTEVAIASVAAGPDGFVAVGSRDTSANGSATAWDSRDGTSWRRLTDPPSFNGGLMTGVTTSAGATVAVGATGVPDNWAAAAWILAPGG